MHFEPNRHIRMISGGLCGVKPGIKDAENFALLLKEYVVSNVFTKKNINFKLQ